MKHLSWIITLPVTVLVLVFVLSNREPVQLDFWPLEMTMTAPLYLMLLLSVLFGFLLALGYGVQTDSHRRRPDGGADPTGQHAGHEVSARRVLLIV